MLAVLAFSIVFVNFGHGLEHSGSVTPQFLAMVDGAPSGDTPDSSGDASFHCFTCAATVAVPPVNGFVEPNRTVSKLHLTPVVAQSAHPPAAEIRPPISTI